jgi:hypothetical protein
MSFAGEPQSKYVAVVLLRGGRMMYGPHAAEVAGRFYRDLMLKEHPTQASRTDSSTLETHPESLPGNCALQFRLAERQN